MGGRGAAWCIRRVERYRSTRTGGPPVCHFEPSCSHFAEEALRTRAIPVALAMVVWRVVRCNLLAVAGSADPVARPRRSLRPNGVPTALGGLAVAGIVALVTVETVNAQSLEGGCTATANGRDPVTMTADDPLVVHEGEDVTVSGNVPDAIAALPADQIQSITTIKVSLVEGLIEPSTEDHPGEGPQWGDTVEVDDYLKWGVGLYKVEGAASGDGWSCTGDGYVKLEDGSPFGKPAGQAAVGLMLVGGGGAVLASRRKWSAPAAHSPTAQEVKADFKDDAERVLGVQDEPEPDPIGEWLYNAGCGGLSFLGVPIFGLPEGAMMAVGSTIAPTKGRRVWVKGHTVLGAICGVLAGLGIAVLVQQLALWPLTILTLVVFPLLVGVLTGLRARRGRPFRYPA